MDTTTQNDARARGQQRHAVEAAIWGMAAVNYELMREVLAGGASNEFVYWSQLLDWRNQTLTPNPDLIYYMAFFDTHEGPVVFDIPGEHDGQALNGSICNLWQVPLEDVGHFGVDKGQGGKYLVLPPGWDQPSPDGYTVLANETFQGYALLRSVLDEGTQEALDKGLELCRRIRVYPLSEADNPPETKARDLHGSVVDTTIPYDLRFYELLHRVVQNEPLLARDRPFAEMLGSIGIRKGEPFNPSSADAAMLQRAVAEAHEWLKSSYENDFGGFFPTGRWFFPAGREFTDAQGAGFDAHPEGYPYLNRGVIYHMAFIGIKRLGIGQFYLVDLRDSDGAFLESGQRYRMRVPANVPVSQFWSVTMYDAGTHAFIRGNSKYSVSSQTRGLVVNDDGTVDVHFAPKAAPGQEANTIETGDSERFELMFRFYGVGQEVMTKQWGLTDVERVAEPGDGAS